MADIPPSSEEREVLKFLDAVDAEAEADKNEVSRPWAENLRQVRGDQWRIERAPYFMANIIKNQVKRKVAGLTESKPQITVSARKAGLSKSEQVVYNSVKAIWDRSQTEDALYRMAFFGMSVGCGFLRTVYDPIRDDVFIEFVDPRRVFIDPALSSMSCLDDAQYIRVDTVAPLADIRLRFPGRGQAVKSDEKYSSYNPAPKTRTSVIASVLQAMPRVYKPGGSPKAGPIPRAELSEYWIADLSIGHDGGLLFPGGRRIVRAGNVLLVDEANPYWDGKQPLEGFEWDIDFDKPWGMDDVQDLRRLQEAINRAGDAWIKNLLVGSNFKIIADLDALDQDQWDKVTNEAGLTIKKKPQREFRYEPPVQLGAEVPQAIEGLIRLCNLLTGNSEASGAGMVKESSDLEGLQQAPQLLTRAVARRLETMLERVGQKLISRVFQFFTSDRVLHQQGSSHAWVAYTFERQKLLQDDTGKFRSKEELKKMWQDYRFMVTPGSSLASTRIKRTMTALQLRTATGVAPSVRRILAEADIGDPEELIKEGLAEIKWLQDQGWSPPVPRGRGGR